MLINIISVRRHEGPVGTDGPPDGVTGAADAAGGAKGAAVMTASAASALKRTGEIDP